MDLIKNILMPIIFQERYSSFGFLPELKLRVMKMAHTVDLPLKKIFSSTKVTMSHNKVPIHQFLIFFWF